MFNRVGVNRVDVCAGVRLVEPGQGRAGHRCFCGAEIHARMIACRPCMYACMHTMQAIVSTTTTFGSTLSKIFTKICLVYEGFDPIKQVDSSWLFLTIHCLVAMRSSTSCIIHQVSDLLNCETRRVQACYCLD